MGDVTVGGTMRSISLIWTRLKALPSRVTKLERNVRKILTIVESNQREMQQVLSAMSLPDRAVWKNPPTVEGGPGARIFPKGALCVQKAFQQPYFHFWCQRIAEPVRYHRKQWEFVFIAQAAWERGLLSPGRRALGFGVGGEPLTALFAAHGVAVTATDLAPESMVAAGWAATNQHAAGKQALRRSVICSDDLFERNVEFLTCDMNAVSDDFQGYDFCWSACALEHLGSIEAGLAFIERSLACLAPGGFAIHTTEFNLSSDTQTVDNDITVLFRKQDLLRLISRLRSLGHDAAPIDWTEGDGPVDDYIDLPPYRAEPHLKASIAGYRTTSLGLIVRRAAA